MKDDFRGLPTEEASEATRDLDLLPTEEMLRRINDEDARVPEVVRRALPEIAVVTDAVAAAFGAGGRLHTFGAGTSGRLAVLDAVECRPTFGVPEDLVQGHIAGGMEALVRAVEGAEDDPLGGRAAVREADVTSSDVVIALSAGGRAPYCVGVLEEARARRAFTAAVTCNPDTPLHALAETVIEVPVGPEVIGGSTRMKAGTAQKLVLNMISTGAMVRTGRTLGNLMVALTATNAKLRARACRLVAQVTGLREGLEELLEAAAWDVRRACVMHVRKLSAEAAARELERHDGSLRRALITRR